jgi:hypothetical protein
MAIPMAVEGIVVAALKARPYNFQGEDGSPVSGTSRQAYLVADFGEAPLLLKFPDEMADEHQTLVLAGEQTEVRVRGEVRRNALVVSRIDALTA